MSHLERLKASDLDRNAAAQPAAPELVGVIPVAPGDTIPLPFDPEGLLARLDLNGNLAIRSGDRTYVLQSYVASDLRAPVTVLADDGSAIDLPLVIAATGPEVVFPTAGGFTGAPSGNGVTGNGIFEPFSDTGAEPALSAVGVLDDTTAPPADAPLPLRTSPDLDLPERLTSAVTPPAQNLPPVAADVALAASEDGGPVDGAFDASDPDPADQGKLAFAILTQPAEGTVKDNGDGTFAYDPGTGFQALALGESSAQTFTYQATDPQSATSNIAIVTVTVTGVNDLPVATSLSVETTEDGPPVSVSAIADDPDSDDDPGTLDYQLAIPLPPDQGKVIDDGGGKFTFDPEDDFQQLSAGEIQEIGYAYTVTDSHGATSDIGIVRVNVIGINDAPTAQPLSFSTTEDGPVLLEALAGDDIDNDDDAKTLTYILGSLFGKGTLTGNGDGTFTFDPGNDFDALQDGDSDVASFTYRSEDNHGALSGDATVTITVTGVNDAPRADDVGASAAEDGGKVKAAFSATDVDDSSAGLVFTVKSQPDQGVVTNNSDGTFTFDPGSGFQELAEGETTSVSFLYSASDPHGAESNDATATITVTGVNDDPTADGILLAAARDGKPVTHDFEGDDIDSDDDQASLAYVITTQPTLGTVVNNGDGTFTFNPGADFQDLRDDQSKLVTFTYTATDGHGAVSNVATVGVVVFGLNSAPVAADVAATTDEDSALTKAFGVTDKQDSPADLTYEILNGPAAGSVSINDDGTFTFDPGDDFQQLAAGASQLVTFTYKATDTQGASSNTATVTLTVNGLNDAPVAADGAIASQEDGPAIPGTFSADDADSDDDPASLTYVILSPPVEGTVTNNDDGTFSFAPGAGFQDLSEGETRDVTFTWQAVDSHGAASNVATTTITVTGKNDAPTAANLSGSATEGTVSAPIAFAGDDPDSDDNQASLAYAILQQPSGGTVINNGDGTFTFDPGTDFDFLQKGQTATATFTYQATDSHGAASAPATVTITVIGSNVAPISPECPIPPPSILATYQFTAGTAGPDTINRSGANGNQWIQAFGGNDNLTGGNLGDLIEGGAGNDTIDGSGGADIILAGAGNDTILGNNENDCIDAGAGNDTVDGGNSNDDLHGDDGDDSLLGGEGEDTLEGGGGNDTLNAGNGQDVLFGDDGHDSLTGGEGDDKLDGGIGNDTLDGGNGQDVLACGDGDDKADGGEGDDKLDGGIGNDTLAGGNGQDKLDGGDGADQITGANGDDQITGGAGNDRLSGDEGNDVIDGGTGDDVIFGGDGDDRLTGGDGVDIIEGGQGHDTIDGKPGNVTIRFSSILDAGDVISDLDVDPSGGQDFIDLDPLFDSLQGALGPLNAQARSDLLQITLGSGVAQLFIDADKDAATTPILIASITTSGPLEPAIIVDGP